MQSKNVFSVSFAIIKYSSKKFTHFSLPPKLTIKGMRYDANDTAIYIKCDEWTEHDDDEIKDFQEVIKVNG